MSIRGEERESTKKNNGREQRKRHRGRKSKRAERREPAPLTFLIVFCEAGEGERDTKQRERGEVRGNTRGQVVVDPKHG